MSTLLNSLVLALIFAAFCWARFWLLCIDNVAAVHIINKGSTANPAITHTLRQLFWLSAITGNNFRFTAVHIQGQSHVLANAVAHPHQPTQCLSFYRHLLLLMPQPHVNALLLVHHMSSDSADSLCCRVSGC